MKALTTFVLSLFALSVFGQKKIIVFPPPVLGMEYPEFINACELLSHKNELAYTRFIYSGIDEYWGLRPETSCNEINADLNIPDEIVIRKEYLKNLKDVHKNYARKYLIIDAIGTFQNGNASGYGHLGSNNSQFLVKYIIDIQIFDKKKN